MSASNAATAPGVGKRRKGALTIIEDAVMLHSRRRKLRQFFSLCPVGSTVLDIGVSGDVRWEHNNYFAAHYDRDPATYTGLGINDMTKVQAKYPQLKFVRYDGTRMPFDDGAFDWAFSNAVIEHVGDDEAQLSFLNEMLRVSKSVYFTTPNRWFPIETHSKQLFRHWSREGFDRWARARKNGSYLVYPALNLLGRRDIVRLLERSRAHRWKISANRMLGWPMTFNVVAAS